jgi:hypothetical protein
VAAAAGASAAATRLEEPAAQRVARCRGVVAQARVRGREPAHASQASHAARGYSRRRRSAMVGPRRRGSAEAHRCIGLCGAHVSMRARGARNVARSNTAWRRRRRSLWRRITALRRRLARDGREAMRPLSNQSISPPPPCLKGCVCGTRLLEDAVP